MKQKLLEAFVMFVLALGLTIFLDIFLANPIDILTNIILATIVFVFTFATASRG